MERTLPTCVEPATTGTPTVHLAWADGPRRTLCPAGGRPVVGWVEGGREVVTCRSCLARLDRYRWSPDDFLPPVSASELEEAGFLLP